MKVAISATGATLEAEVDPRFGRCQYFVFVDTDTMDYEAVENASAIQSGGAGISSAQMVVGKGVAAVMTGNCGPNAHQVLVAANVKIYTGVNGTLRDVVAAFKSGRYEAGSQPTVRAHYGMGGGMTGGGMSGGGMGRGMGMGGGMGRGMGGGMSGGGMGRGMGGGMMQSPGVPDQQPDPAQGLEDLKAQSEKLAQQLAEIQKRIEEFGKKAD